MEKTSEKTPISSRPDSDPAQETPKANKLAPKSRPGLNISSAISYNTRSRTSFSKFDAQVKSLLGTNSDWNTAEFANAVYDWQEANGLTGNQADGKLGPITGSKMAELHANLFTGFEAKDFYMAGKDTTPRKAVLGLSDDVARIQKRLTATDIPMWLVLGWIQAESGGRMNDLTTSAGFSEVGLFQISAGEAKRLGVDTERVLVDLDYSIESGLNLIRMRQSDIDNILPKYPTLSGAFARGSDMYWRLVMLAFSAGHASVNQYLSVMSSQNFVPRSWGDFLTWASKNQIGFRRNPLKWSTHVERAFQIGQNAVQQLGAAVQHKVATRVKNAKRRARLVVLGKLL